VVLLDFLERRFCTEDDTTKNFQTPICNNPGTTDSTCSVEVTTEVVEECGFACSQGTCIVCDEDLDCNDGDSGTNDFCENPGTIGSFCLNEDIITCSSNSDCGENGFLDEQFCEEGDVHKTFVSYTCNEPGSSSSFCTNELLPVLSEECNSGCFEGGCALIECSDDLDCVDGDPNTDDSCVNPGTPSSFCVNGGVECFVDSDCGVDNFIGDFFCSAQGDVAQDFESFECINAGTVSSFCDSDRDEVIIEMCSESCSGGECIDVGCFFDSECDDGLAGTDDSCVNPGQEDSFCLNVVIECSSDLDCNDGNSGTLDNCVNPGQEDSFCTNEVIECN